MEGENVADYNLRMIRLWETTKVCSKFCKTVKYEQELSDDDKSCLSRKFFFLSKILFN